MNKTRSENIANQAADIENQDILSKLLLESKNIEKLNVGITDHIRENKEMVEKFNRDISALKYRLKKGKESANEVKILKQQLNGAEQFNKSLGHNIQILKQNLEDKNRHMNVLKRELLQRKIFPEKIERKNDEIRLLKEQLLRSEKNILPIKKDIVGRDRYINFLQRQLSKKKVEGPYKKIELLDQNLSEKEKATDILTKKIDSLRRKLDDKDKLLRQEREKVLLSKKHKGDMETEVKKIKLETPSLWQEIKERQEREEKLKARLEKESKLLFNIGIKMQNIIAENKKLKDASNRNVELSEQSQLLSQKNASLKKELFENEKELRALSVRITKREIIINKFKFILAKLYKTLLHADKEEKQQEKKAKEMQHILDDLTIKLEEKDVDISRQRRYHSSTLESLESKYRGQVTKFIKQYLKTKIYSESQIKELKKRLEQKETQLKLLRTKLNFLKKEVNKIT